jgi:N-acetyl-anhydromuramyl-L-alanine amidase AmpD
LGLKQIRIDGRLRRVTSRICERLNAMSVIALLALSGAGCKCVSSPGAIAKRTGDEIVVAGQFVHTGTPVVLWMDPGGYDAYRVERRFSPINESSWDASKAANKDLATPNRFGLRTNALTEAEMERVRGGGWDLPLLQKRVDQFVYHFDASGTSRQCFKVLHDIRDLSVHFMLDLDGTIYQTLDLKERAWHATFSNGRSVGIEIANPGAFSSAQAGALNEWYKRDADGTVRVQIPPQFGDGGLRTKGFVPRPARPEVIRERVQNQDLLQFDFTPEQYRALIKLTAAVCKVLPRIPCDYPRDSAGQLITAKLPDEEFAKYHGLLGHFHVQENKVDPGPAFQWDYVVTEARKLIGQDASTIEDHARIREKFVEKIR